MTLNMMQPGCPSATRALACERAFVRARDPTRTRADVKAGVEAQENL